MNRQCLTWGWHSHNKDFNASDPGEWQSLPWGETQRDGKAFFSSECKICPPSILLLKVYDLETSLLQRLTTSASSFSYIYKINLPPLYVYVIALPSCSTVCDRLHSQNAVASSSEPRPPDPSFPIPIYKSFLPFLVDLIRVLEPKPIIKQNGKTTTPRVKFS